MWRVEKLVYHEFIPDPLGPSAVLDTEEHCSELHNPAMNDPTLH